jgi:hydroxybutyrate-dimer hydrolase
VPGREFQALAKLPGARQPHRVLVQLPDAFEPANPCVVVTASSGSRGVYGAIALAGSWGLSKHARSPTPTRARVPAYVDTATPDGALLDGTRGVAGGAGTEFDVPPAAPALRPAWRRSRPACALR